MISHFPKKITIVCHDWGSGLGFHWCNENRDRVQSIVHMESLVGPVVDWELFPKREIFQELRSAAGEELNLKQNFMVERFLVDNILRSLDDAEMDEYRAPYQDEKSRLPTLTWPRETPEMTEGPKDVLQIVIDYSMWLGTDETVPKLYIHSKPGLFSSAILMYVEDWPNQMIVEAEGLHFLQEDSPDTIGKAINEFIMNM